MARLKGGGMGKRERHAEKLQAQEAQGVAIKAQPARVLRAGWVDGWRWGSAALGLALRRPGFALLGHLMLGLALALAALSRNAAAWALALGLILMGVECAGSAARAGVLALKGHPSPWRAWIEPLGSLGALGRAVARALVAGAGLVAVGAGADFSQRALWAAGSTPGQRVGLAALGTCAAIFLAGLWLLVASSKAGGARELGRAAKRALRAPLAVAGLCVFWMALAMLIQVSLAMLLVLAASQSGSPVTMEQMGALMALAAVGFCAAMTALAAGIGAGDLAERERRLRELAGQAPLAEALAVEVPPEQAEPSREM